MLRKRRNNLAEVVSTLVQQSEEEEAKVGVAAFLCQFFSILVMADWKKKEMRNSSVPSARIWRRALKILSRERKIEFRYINTQIISYLTEFQRLDIFRRM